MGGGQQASLLKQVSFLVEGRRVSSVFALSELWKMNRSNCCRPSQSRRKRDAGAMLQDTFGVSNLVSPPLAEPSEFGDPDYQTSPRRCVRMQNRYFRDFKLLYWS
jgi:hypothetical protein